MPRDLVMRKKAGFPIPVGDYIAPLATPRFFAGGFCETRLGLGRRGVERSMSSWRQHKDSLFGFIALETWGRIHLMGQSVSDVEQLVVDCERAHAVASGGK